MALSFPPEPGRLERPQGVVNKFRQAAQQSLQRRANIGRDLLLVIPYIWLVLFFLVPFLLVLKISFSEAVLGTPPFESVFTWAKNQMLVVKLNLANYHFLWVDDLYAAAYLQSLSIATISTFICLIVGYPIAYGIARVPVKYRSFLLMLVILPFWTSFLIRIYAWISLLNPHGFINEFLLGVGIIDKPLELINNNFAVCLGIVYAYLPFMVLPLYASLSKMDISLLEAAYDLGCRPWRTFLTVTLPLSMPGIISGAMLVFIPAMGEYVIPELLGGADNLMIGHVLWTEFFSNRDWPVASAVAVVLLGVLVIPVMLFQRWQAKMEPKSHA